jgi:Sec-independent protein translocase protein TatA
VVVLALVAGVLLVLFAADRLVKARVRARWKRQMRSRLAEASARADEQQLRHQAASQASKAMTSLMPAISHPPLSPPGGPPKRRGSTEHTGPHARVATHPGGRTSAPAGRATRAGEHPDRSAGRP